MKFTTEIGLRNLYREKPFTSYKLEQDERLTPGARQFLNDKNITYGLEGDGISNLEEDEKEGEENFKKIRIIKQLELVYISFLLGSRDLVYEDIVSSKYIADLSKIIYRIGCNLENSEYELVRENIDIETCKSIDERNIFTRLGSCHDITDFYINLELGKAILIMKQLQIQVEVLYIEISIYNKEEENISRKVFELINYISNSLSQKICYLIGGKRCQRKS